MNLFLFFPAFLQLRLCFPDSSLSPYLFRCSHESSHTESKCSSRGRSSTGVERDRPVTIRVTISFQAGMKTEGLLVSYNKADGI